MSVAGEGARSIRIVRGSIIDCPVEAIVNAANSSLLGGGGVDGVIHRAAGPGLLAECRTLGACPTGEARITSAYDLPFRHIIHAVGPIWRGGEEGEAELLGACYRASLDLAASAGCRSVGFPAISTGAYSYPLAPAADVAIEVCRRWLASAAAEIEIVFCCIDRRTEAAFERALR